MGESFQYIVGVDEVGRGPLAGPVLVCAVLLTKVTDKEIRQKVFDRVRDSKQLSEKKRKEYSKKLKLSVKYKCASASPKLIDRIGIQKATEKCVAEVLNNIVEDKVNTLVLLDGGLKAPYTYNHRVIVKGDEKEISIAAASIIAKVRRDSYMKRISNRNEKYAFCSNKGYGTKEHIEAIKLNGITKYHRKTFCKNFATI